MKKIRKQVSEQEQQKVVNLMKENLIGEPLLFAYVFGSFINNLRFDDIDIAVFVDIKRIPLKSLLEYEIDLELKLNEILKGYKIDVRVLNNAPIPFRYQVIKNGLPVFVRDEDAMVDFETLTYSLYFDFAPFRIAYLKEVLDAKV